jgi:hypothetical protein
VIFRRDLQQRRESRRVRLDAVSYLLGDVLVNEQDGDIFALGGELVECGFDGCVLGLRVHDQEILLAVWRLRDMLDYASGCIS